MEQRDFYLREIEKIAILISKFINTDFNSNENKEEIRLIINNEYLKLFSITEYDIYLNNKTIQEILNYRGNENEFIQKLEAFIFLIEHDYNLLNQKKELRIVIHSLIKKLIKTDSKNYYPERIKKLSIYEEKHIE